MARLHRRHLVDDAGLARLRQPRDDFVAEAIAPDPGPDAVPGPDPGCGPDPARPATRGPAAPGAAGAGGAAGAAAHFVAVGGGFRSYDRSLRWRRRDGAAAGEGDTAGPGDTGDAGAAGLGWEVEEHIEFRMATPGWSWLFTPLARRALRRPRPAGWQPWWAPPERLDPRSATVLALLATLTLVSSYLGTLLSQTLTFAAADFGASKSAQGILLAMARLGIAATLVATTAADRVGRSRLLRVSLGLACLAMGAVTLAPGLLWFGLGQTVARGLTTAADIIIVILAAEEMPARSRAWATSVLALIGGLGSGMVVWLLPLADLARGAWRLIYVPPLLFLPLVTWSGRRLPESRRFLLSTARSVAGTDATPPSGPLGAPRGGVGQLPDVEPRPAPARLGSQGRRRLALLAFAAFLLLVFAAPASQFQNEFLRDERGFSAMRITVFTLLSGTPAGLGVWFGGRLAEGIGRRAVGAIGLVGGSSLVAVSYLGHGAVLWAGSIVGTMAAGLTVPAMRVYGPELFPTRLRARANGITTLLAVAGSATGVLLVGSLGDRYGLGPPIAALALAPLTVAALVLTIYPETANRTLEQLNPGDPPLPPGHPR